MKPEMIKKTTKVKKRIKSTKVKKKKEFKRIDSNIR